MFLFMVSSWFDKHLRTTSKSLSKLKEIYNTSKNGRGFKRNLDFVPKKPSTTSKLNFKNPSFKVFGSIYAFFFFGKLIYIYIYICVATAGSTWSSILTFAVSVENQYTLAAVNRHFSLALKAPVVWDLWPEPGVVPVSRKIKHWKY